MLAHPNRRGRNPVRVCPHCDLRTEAAVCPTDQHTTIDEGVFKKKPKDPTIGKTIAGRYEVDKRLGRGGMGAVYRARHVHTGGFVALKLMNPGMDESDDAMKRFFIEAQNTHRLHHANTVTVSDFGQTDEGMLYLVMEYVTGRSLGAALKEEKRLSPARVVRIASQMLRSLGEAHSLGIVHRDMKPDNVMLIDQFGSPDFVKVLDFGISKALDSTGAGTQAAIGTPMYMAPEQWRNTAVDGRTDLYAVGGMMYQMLAGRLAFDVPKGVGWQQQAIAYMQAHMRTPPLPLLAAAPGACHPRLAEVVMRMLAKKPDERPADATATLELFGQIAAADLPEDLQELGAPTPDEPATKPALDAIDAVGTPALPVDLTVPLAAVAAANAAPGLAVLPAARPAPPAPGDGVPGSSSTGHAGWEPSEGSHGVIALVVAAAATLLIGGAGAWWWVSTQGAGESSPSEVVTENVLEEQEAEEVAAEASPIVAGAGEVETAREGEAGDLRPAPRDDETTEAAEIAAEPAAEQPAPAMILTVTTEPAGVDVYLPDAEQPLGTTPFEWTLAPAAQAQLDADGWIELTLRRGDERKSHRLERAAVTAGAEVAIAWPEPAAPEVTRGDRHPPPRGYRSPKLKPKPSKSLFEL